MYYYRYIPTYQYIVYLIVGQRQCTIEVNQLGVVGSRSIAVLPVCHGVVKIV